MTSLSTFTTEISQLDKKTAAENLKSTRLTILKKKFFGLTSAGGNWLFCSLCVTDSRPPRYPTSGSVADALGVTLQVAGELDALREDLAFSLGQVEDLAISNEVYYFNKDDLKGVSQILSDIDAESDGGEVVQRQKVRRTRKA